MDILFSPEVLAVVTPVLAGIAGLILTKVVKDAAKRLIVQKAVELALPIAARLVTEIASKTANTTDDKVAAVLRALADAGHEKHATPATEAKARAVFDSVAAEALKESK